MGRISDYMGWSLYGMSGLWYTLTLVTDVELASVHTWKLSGEILLIFSEQAGNTPSAENNRIFTDRWARPYLSTVDLWLDNSCYEHWRPKHSLLY